MRVSPSFVAGACDGAAWAHIFGGILLTDVNLWLGLGVLLMSGAWRVCQFRWERRAKEVC